MENETCHSDSANVLGESKLSKNLSSITEGHNKTSDLIKEVKNYSLDNKKRETKFVINTIAYVPDHKFSDDSSSEETDGSFSDAAFNFDIKDIKTFPFTTRQTTKPKIVDITEKLSDQFSDCSVSDDSLSETSDSSFSDADTYYNLQDKSFVYFTTKEKRKAEIQEVNEEVNEELPDSNQSDSNSSIITPFFKKLSQNGFEEDDKDKLPTSVSVIIALNRMKSLSTRKNKSLHLELNSKIEESKIKYEKLGFFWACEWYENVNGIRKRKPVDQEKVRKFYKQLKTLNKEKAEHFREMQEKNVFVPFQDLREFAKNHDKTKKLVNEFRQEDPNANIYLSLIDLDTVDFNKIYSAYLRVVKDYNTPTVMSTGYEFPEDEPAYQRISQIDRKIRVITARHIPLGTYYPEPNTCVLIEKGRDTLLESFIDKTRKNGNLESACLLKEVQKRENATFVFSNDNPLITTIPDRARRTKNHKTLISFTPEFEQGSTPTENDLKSSKSVTQNNFHEHVWLTNLFINNGIKFETYDIKNYIKHPADLKHSEKLVEIYVKKTKKDKDRIGAIDKLKEYVRLEYIGVVDVIFKKGVLNYCKHLVSVIFNPEEEDEFEMHSIEKSEKKKYKAIYELQKYVISNDVDAIVKATEEIKNYITRLKIRSFRSEYVHKLFNIGIDRDLTWQDPEVLEYICEKKDVFEALKKGDVDTDSLLELLEDNLSEVQEAISKGYSIEDIVEKFEENPLHLRFMAGDPTQIVYEESDDQEIVDFGIENYDVDIDEVRSQLNEGHDIDGAALMHFDLISGEYDDPYDDYCCYNFEEEEEKMDES